MRRRPLKKILGWSLALLLIGGGALGYFYLRESGSAASSSLAGGSIPAPVRPPPAELLLGLGLGGGPEFRTTEQPGESPLHLSVDLRSPRARNGSETSLVLGGEAAPWWAGLELVADDGQVLAFEARAGTSPVFVASEGLGAAVSLEVAPGVLTEGQHHLRARLRHGEHAWSSRTLALVIVPGRRPAVLERRLAVRRAVLAGRAKEALALLEEAPVPEDDLELRGFRAEALAAVGRRDEALEAYERMIVDWDLDPHRVEPPTYFLRKRAALERAGP